LFMTHDPKKYLLDMLEGCRFLREITTGKSIQDYASDRVFRFAVERQLQNVGEALRQLHSHHPTVAQGITEYQNIIRFRHALVHGYDSVRPDLVWDVVELKPPALCAELETLLREC